MIETRVTKTYNLIKIIYTMIDLNSEQTPQQLQTILSFANDKLKEQKNNDREVQSKWTTLDFISAKINLNSNLDFWKEHGVYSVKFRFCEIDPYSEYGFGYSINAEYFLMLLILGCSKLIEHVEKRENEILSASEHENVNTLTSTIHSVMQTLEELKKLIQQLDKNENQAVVFFILNNELDYSFDEDFF